MFQQLASHKSYYYKNPNNNLIKVSPVQNNVLAFGKQFNDPIDGVWWAVTVVNFNPFLEISFSSLRLYNNSDKWDVIVYSF